MNRSFFVLSILLFCLFTSPWYYSQLTDLSDNFGQGGEPSWLGFGITAILFAILLGLLMPTCDKKEGFHFEVGKSRYKCQKCGFRGKPLTFDYTGDADRVYYCGMLQEQNKTDKYLGRDGLEGNPRYTVGTLGCNIETTQSYDRNVPKIPPFMQGVC